MATIRKSTNTRIKLNPIIHRAFIIAILGYLWVFNRTIGVVENDNQVQISHHDVVTTETNESITTIAYGKHLIYVLC